jgi:hypothetical protein
MVGSGGASGRGGAPGSGGSTGSGGLAGSGDGGTIGSFPDAADANMDSTADGEGISTVRYGYPDITTADEWCVLDPQEECLPCMADYLLGEEISIDSPLLVTKLGANVLAAGRHMVMALYTDSGTKPDTMVASTAPTSIVNGSNELPVVDQVRVAAGNYWLMAVYDASTQIAQALPFSTLIWYQSMDFSTALPARFGARAGTNAASYTSKYLGYYVVGTP